MRCRHTRCIECMALLCCILTPYVNATYVCMWCLMYECLEYHSVAAVVTLRPMCSLSSCHSVLFVSGSWQATGCSWMVRYAVILTLSMIVIIIIIIIIIISVYVVLVILLMDGTLFSTCLCSLCATRSQLLWFLIWKLNVCMWTHLKAIECYLPYKVTQCYRDRWTWQS